MSASHIITIDLGTTNIKVGIYDSELKELCIRSLKVEYISENNSVEFDTEGYWDICKRGIKEVIEKSGIDPGNILTISLTGQAESLVLLDSSHRPLRKGISWMDSRSLKECEILKRNFDVEIGYNITGQPDIIPTWPITKILWIKRNEKSLFGKVSKYLLIKDFIIFKLTGKFLAEYTVYNFSYYLDIIRKKYWNDILDFVGIEQEQLPVLIEPGETAGTVTGEIAGEFNLRHDVTVNTGALDHFAGMIGTGNVNEGLVSETTGTVLAIATLTDRPMINEYNIPCHYNAVKNTYVLLPVCESGGVSLEWFKTNFFPEETFEYMNTEIEKSGRLKNEVIFLPYLTGTNAPEFDVKARGVFYGLNIHHTKVDFARAVMEGVSYLLKKNVEYLEKLNIKVDSLISLGGGSKSEVWNQMKADITGKEILIPEYEEAASLGAAVLAAVRCGLCKSVREAAGKYVKIKKIYSPASTDLYKEGYKKFIEIYKSLTPVFHS